MRTLTFFVSIATFLTACPGRNPVSHGRDASATRAIDAGTAASAAPAGPPENLLVTVRGTSLRRAIPLMFGNAPVGDLLEQVSRQVTPGIGSHGDQIDPDSPFAIAGIVADASESTLTLLIAWPLKPGMEIAQQARSLHGFRRVSEGLYAPTSPDAGANADHQCWVGQRHPVGWMLICGPTPSLPQVAEYLHTMAQRAPDNAPVLDLDIHAGFLRRMFSRQLALLDEHAPPQTTDAEGSARRAMFDEARRSVALLSSLSNDAESAHGALTQDENSMHLRLELEMAHASSDIVRGLLSASAGRRAAADLATLLPASVTGYVVDGFDRVGAATALGGATVDPVAAAQGGPELARVISTTEELKSLLPLGERIDGYAIDDGYTLYHVIRRADAVQFVSDLRVALNSVPARPLPGGGTLRDVATALPTPGLTGPNYLRIGRNVHIPPGMNVPPEVRAAIDRSMLVVADGDHVIAVLGRDPVARFQAMSQGARLSVTVPQGAVLAGHITPPSFPPLFWGSTVPGIPESHTTDALDFSLTVERRGEGAHVVLAADAPINAAMEIRVIYDQIQQVQAEMMRRAMAQQQAAMQQQQAGGGGGGGGGPGAGGPSGGGPRPGGPQHLDPSMLPEPPNLQLQAPP